MKFNEIIEGIRRGQKELQQVPLDNFTLGLEFEVTVDPAAYKDADDEGYTTDLDDEEIDPDDEMEAREQAYDEFVENHMRDYDPSDWFNDNYRQRVSDFVEEYELEPRYGWADAEAAAKQERQRQIDRYGEELLDRLEGYVENIPSEEEIQAMSVDEMTPFLLDYYLNVYDRQVTKEQILAKINSITKEELDSVYAARLAFVKSMLTPSVDETTVSVIDENGEIVDVDWDISDFDDVARYFDTTALELADMTSEEWGQVAIENASEEFNDWWMTNRESYLSRHGIGSQANAIAYAASVTKKTIPEFDSTWKVVKDGTDGVDAEIVSPPYTVSKSLDVMHRVLKMIEDDPHLGTSQATGLHVNIGTFSRQQALSIDWLKFLIIVDAGKILREFSRQHNGFAKDRLPEMIRGLTTGEIQNYSRVVSGLNQRLMSMSTKLSAVNMSKLLSDNIIEVRAPGNKGYELKGDRIEEYIRIILHAVEIASDPNKHKKAYIKKLHKIFDLDRASSRFSYNTPIEYFRAVSNSPSYTKGSLVQSLAKSLRGIEDGRLADKLINDVIKNQIGDDLVDYMKTKEPTEKWLELIDSTGKAAQNSVIGELIRFVIKREIERRENARSS